MTKAELESHRAASRSSSPVDHHPSRRGGQEIGELYYYQQSFRIPVRQRQVSYPCLFLVSFGLFSYRSHKVLLSSLYKKLVTELEKKLKKTVLLLSARNIQSRWIKENRTQQRSNSRTLTAVYASILDELLLPGIIIGSRTRVRLDGSSFTKLTLDKSEQHFLEERVDAIRAAYRRLANRDIEIDFQKEATFYVLKKGEKK